MSTREYSTRDQVANGGNDQWARVPPGVPGVVGGDRGAAAAPLSMAHIGPLKDRPGVHWSEGASILKVSKGGHCEPAGGGARGKIQGFSDESRRRLLQLIGRVRRDAELPLFVTLTWPELFPGPGESKRYLKIFNQRLMRRWPGAGSIWKLEPQDRGAPHFHLLVWGVPLLPEIVGDEVVLGLREWVPLAWFEIAGQGDQNHLLFHQGRLARSKPCVQPVRTFNGVWFYAAKYLGKAFLVAGWSEKWTGRFWGKVNPENIPFGEEREQEVTYKDAVQLQRYQRRFAHLKPYGRSMTSYCDADQWVRRLVNAAPPGTMGIGDQAEPRT